MVITDREDYAPQAACFKPEGKSFQLVELSRLAISTPST